VVRKWFSYRARNPRRHRPSSPLDARIAVGWRLTWTFELIDLLTVLHRLVDLEPAQAALLDHIVAGPQLTVTDLTGAGVFPVPDVARRAHRHSYDLFTPV
jgi:hypothetical protein